MQYNLKSSGSDLRVINFKLTPFDAGMQDHLSKVDPEIYDLISKEEDRQANSISLIASENFSSVAVQNVVGSILINKYSEGFPGARYYGGNSIIDQIEALCCERALRAFKLDDNHWGVIVQVYSGSPANFAVYTALLEPNDKILGLDLPHGGHLSHGYQTNTKKVSAVSKYFTTRSYHVDLKTNLIDYEELSKLAKEFQPKCIVAGISAYSRLLDYKKFREASNSCNALLLADIAHIAGLVATECIPSPFEYADIVTTTTHKTLRGPRGALIFYRKQPSIYSTTHVDVQLFEQKLRSAVFPGLQGGPHEHTIAAIAVCLELAMRPEFVEYQKQVIANSKAICSSLQARGHKILTGGTDIHFFLVDLKQKEISGSRVEKVCEAVNITINKNTLPTDTNPVSPSGIRIGTPAITTRGVKPEHCELIAHLIDKTINLALIIQKKAGPKLSDFQKELINFGDDLANIRNEVVSFISMFPRVGSTIRKT